MGWLSQNCLSEKARQDNREIPNYLRCVSIRAKERKDEGRGNLTLTASSFCEKSIFLPFFPGGSASDGAAVCNCGLADTTSVFLLGPRAGASWNKTKPSKLSCNFHLTRIYLKMLRYIPPWQWPLLLRPQPPVGAYTQSTVTDDTLCHECCCQHEKGHVTVTLVSLLPVFSQNLLVLSFLVY